MRTAIWIVTSVFVMLVALLIVDALGRRLVLKGTTDVRIVKSETTNSRALFVYYQGILARPDSSSAQVRSIWLAHGDVMLVDWSGDRFIASDVVDAMTTTFMEHVDEYDTVVFIASSMGGLLSYDTAMQLKTLAPNAVMKFILLDPPTRRGDFQYPLDKLSYIAQITGGPFLNLFSKPYFNATFVEPKDENIEPFADRKALARHVHDAKSFSISMNNDWVRYITGHPTLEAGSLSGYDAVYVRSSRDHDTVRPETYHSWVPVFGGELPRMSVDSAHNAFNERASDWRAGFKKALGMIGIS